MKTQYFQRYHQKENVATANTMLLLARLYTYSADKFYKFLKALVFGDNGFEPEIIFNMQEKSSKSVPDLTIKQNGFKVVVETKLTDWFYQEQLMKHLESFKNEEYKVLITLSSEDMKEEKKNEVNDKIKNYNEEHDANIWHINTTFEKITEEIKEVLDDYDFEMIDILDDYLDYCRTDRLIKTGKQKMKARLANTTFDFNVANKVYYDSVYHGFSSHEYLGLYKGKSILAIGKIEAIITFTEEKGIQRESGDLTAEREETIRKACSDGKKYGYPMKNLRFFFVDEFCETNFSKVSKHGMQGSKIFDLTEILERKKLPKTKEIAEILKTKTWE